MTIKYTLTMASTSWRLASMLIIIIAACWSLSFSQYQLPSDYYQRGIDLQQKGEYEAALNMWAKAKDQLNEPSYKIGRAYISLAAEEQMNDYYKQASQMYMWGLQSNSINGEQEVLLKDLEYMNALINLNHFKALKNKVQDSNSIIFDDLYEFWIANDITPLTDYNERLIEHFERIAYVNNHFTYGEAKKKDDRASTYLRFGKPDYKKEGQLRYNSGIIDLILDRRLRTKISSQSISNSYLETKKFNLESNVRQLFEPVRYELWIYNNLNSELDNTIYIFGEVGGGNRFEEKNSLEDFIPNTAFRKPMNNEINTSTLIDNQSTSQQGSNIASSGSESLPQINITPAILFQIMYYRQFAAFDRYFSSAYEDMIDRFSNPTLAMSNNLAQQYKSRHVTKLLEIQAKAPEAKSNLLNNVLKLPVEQYSYRFMNEDGTSYVNVFLEVKPSKSILYDQLLNQGTLDNKSKSTYQLIIGIVDKSKSADHRTYVKKEIPISLNTDVEIFTDISAPYGRNSNLMVSSQIIGQKEKNIFSNGSAFQNDTKALNNLELTVPDVLNSKSLEISDVIIGFKNDDRYSQKIPFKISHDKIIPVGNNLSIYHEVYNLTSNMNDSTKFNISYKIEKEGGFLSFLRKGPDTPIITVGNETKSSRFVNSLEIDTSQLDKGSYKLLITIDDLVGDESISKEVKFEIAER